MGRNRFFRPILSYSTEQHGETNLVSSALCIARNSKYIVHSRMSSPALLIFPQHYQQQQQQFTLLLADSFLAFSQPVIVKVYAFPPHNSDLGKEGVQQQRRQQWRGRTDVLVIVVVVVVIIFLLLVPLSCPSLQFILENSLKRFFSKSTIFPFFISSMKLFLL